MGFKDQWKLKTHQIVHTDHKVRVCSKEPFFGRPFCSNSEKAIHLHYLLKRIPNQVQSPASRKNSSKKVYKGRFTDLDDRADNWEGAHRHCGHWEQCRWFSQNRNWAGKRAKVQTEENELTRCKLDYLSQVILTVKTDKSKNTILSTQNQPNLLFVNKPYFQFWLYSWTGANSYFCMRPGKYHEFSHFRAIS